MHDEDEFQRRTRRCRIVCLSRKFSTAEQVKHSGGQSHLRMHRRFSREAAHDRINGQKTLSRMWVRASWCRSWPGSRWSAPAIQRSSRKPGSAAPKSKPFSKRPFCRGLSGGCSFRDKGLLLIRLPRHSVRFGPQGGTLPQKCDDGFRPPRNVAFASQNGLGGGAVAPMRPARQ